MCYGVSFSYVLMDKWEGVRYMYVCVWRWRGMERGEGVAGVGKLLAVGIRDDSMRLMDTFNHRKDYCHLYVCDTGIVHVSML